LHNYRVICKKRDNNIYFLNLKHDSFTKREGRKFVLVNTDNIVSLYEDKKEVENISKLVKPDEIEKNNYSLAIDRYIISKEIEQLQSRLEEFDLVRLEDIADIRRSQLFKDEGDGKEIYEISPSNFNNAGFTLEAEKVKQIDSQYNRLNTYKLEPYDVLSKNEKKQVLLNFNSEIKMYNEIDKINTDIKQIHNNFLGVK